MALPLLTLDLGNIVVKKWFLPLGKLDLGNIVVKKLVFTTGKVRFGIASGKIGEELPLENEKSKLPVVKRIKITTVIEEMSSVSGKVG